LKTVGLMPYLRWCTEPSTKTALIPLGWAPPKLNAQSHVCRSLCDKGMSRVGLGQYVGLLTVERAMSGSQPAMGPVWSPGLPPAYEFVATHLAPANSVLDVPSVTSAILQRAAAAR